MNTSSPVSMASHQIENFLPGLALALAIGLLIGIERGWRMREERPGSRVAGVRTFAIMGLFGGLIGLTLSTTMHILAPVLGIAATLAILAGYIIDMRKDDNVSATSALAAIVTLGLGIIATAGNMAVASVGAGALLVLLASRTLLHRALHYVSDADLKALVRLSLVVFVILPLLPDASYGPYGLNPQRLWLVVVIIGAISFIGYALNRWLGSHGYLIAATLGAIVSSTAVTLESARRMRENSRKNTNIVNETAIAIASVIMIARSLLLVSALAPLVIVHLIALLLPALLAALIAAALLFWLKGESKKTNKVFIKPPGLRLAFLFAMLVGLLTIAAGWAKAQFGDESAAALVAIGGMVDVDSAIAAIGTLPPDTISPQFAAYAIALPILFNTLLKIALTASIAGFHRGRTAILALAAPAAAIVGVATIQAF